MKKFAFNYNFFKVKRTYKSPMQTNTTSGTPHVWCCDNILGSICLIVSNSGLMTRVQLQKKQKRTKGMKDIT